MQIAQAGISVMTSHSQGQTKAQSDSSATINSKQINIIQDIIKHS